MFAEAKGVLDVAIADERPTAEDDRRWCCAPSPTSCSAARRRRSRISPIRRRQPERRAALARAGLCAPGQMGARRAKASATSRPRSARCRSSCSAWCCKDALRAAIEVGDFAGAATGSTNSRPSACRRSSSRRSSVLSGRLAEGARPHRRCARRLSRGRRIARPAGRGAGTAARDRAALGARRAQAAPKCIAELETLTTAWRGDETEIEALQTARRGSTPRRAATATRSMSCARR